MKRSIFTSLLVLVVALFSGCATAQLNSDVAPNANLGQITKFHVVHLAKDERRVDRLIAQHLNSIGKSATFGERADAPADVEAIVTYQDKWMWDITMYMIELNVQIRNPKSEISLASGRSMRTSLVRKSAEEMIAEIFNDIFKSR